MGLTPSLLFIAMAITGPVAACAPPAPSSTPQALGDKPHEPEPVSGEQELALAWTVKGNWLDVVCEPRSGQVFALQNILWNPHSKTWVADVSRIDMSGGIVKTVSISGGNTAEKLAVMGLKDGQCAFVTYGLRSNVVDVHKPDGSQWWSRKVGSVNVVRAADIDRDGDDELLVGTGGNGLHSLHADGTFHWNALSGKDISDAVVVPAHGVELGAVIAQQSSTKLVFVAADGKVTREVRPNRELANLELKHAAGGGWELLSVDAGEINSFAANGSLIQSIRDSDERVKGHWLAHTAMSHDRLWLGVLLKGGLLLVYDASTGKQVASISTNIPRYSRIAWSVHPTTGRPCLLLATASGLFAYELRHSTLPAR